MNSAVVRASGRPSRLAEQAGQRRAVLVGFGQGADALLFEYLVRTGSEVVFEKPTPRISANASKRCSSGNHGTEVADPYRWLEKADDPATTAWVAAENSLTRSVLDRPEHEAIKARLTELYDYPKISIPEHKGNRYFFFKNTGLQNQSVYYVQEGAGGEPRALIDPNTMSTDGTVALTNTSPTKDGSLVGYAVSRSGRPQIPSEEIADAARAVNRDVIVLCHGGPIAEPDVRRGLRIAFCCAREPVIPRTRPIGARGPSTAVPNPSRPAPALRNARPTH